MGTLRALSTSSGWEIDHRGSDSTEYQVHFIHPRESSCQVYTQVVHGQDTSDVVIEVGVEPVRNTRKKKASTSTSSSATSFYAHSLIIQQCSSTLGELCKQGGESMSIADVKPEIFHHLLYHMYGGKVSSEDLKENAEDIINVADKYGVVSLKLEAEASFVDTTAITFENAIDTLLFADSKNCALLKEAVMDFIADNREEAVKSLAFENVPGAAMKDLLTAVNRKEGKASISGSDFSLMRVNILRSLLHEKGLDVDGSREVLIARLEQNA